MEQSLVQEIIDFSNCDVLFPYVATRTELESFGFHVTENDEWAQMWRGYQEDNFPENHPILQSGFSEWNWVCECEELKARKGIYDLPDGQAIEQEIRRQFASYKAFGGKIPESYQWLAETIYSDLQICAIARALHGKTLPFHEQLFQAYRLGAVPCGWMGEYPEGKMVIYI
jgi:hypothetical protein